MTKAKRRAMLEVAYDLIEKVHTDVCNSTDHSDDTAQYTLDVLRRIILLDQRLNGRKR